MTVNVILVLVWGKEDYDREGKSKRCGHLCGLGKVVLLNHFGGYVGVCQIIICQAAHLHVMNFFI